MRKHSAKAPASNQSGAAVIEPSRIAENPETTAIRNDTYAQLDSSRSSEWYSIPLSSKTPLSAFSMR